ncbi:MAG: response regulator [Acidobacteriota bacterium]|nr:response regulator [Acidobacteriota bacterium]
MQTTSFSWDVLVVDDDEDVRELIVSFFTTLGARVATAQDGRAAVLELERSAGRYGLVVTDVNLPGADGFSVLAAARRANASCYVVVVTGYASLDSAIQAVRGGAYDYLPKPFSLGQLDLILQRITDRASLEEENRRLALAGQRLTDRLSLSSLAGVEDRLAAIESAVARIESSLGTQAGPSSARR